MIPSDRTADEARLARLIENIVENERWPGDRVITLGEEQRLRPPRPTAALWWSVAAVAAAGLAATAFVLTRAEQPRPALVAEPVPVRAPTPAQTVAPAPPPVAHRPAPPPAAYYAEVRPRHEDPPVAAPERTVPDRRASEATSDAYSPHAAEPLSGERLRLVLIEDHRRTRELNAKQLEALQAQKDASPGD